MIRIRPRGYRPSPEPSPAGVVLSQLAASRTLAGSLVLMLLLGLLSLTSITPAFAAPVSEITARWADNTAAQVSTGDVVTAEWRVNLNDDAAAPSNAPVPNVIFTVTAEFGVFKTIPDSCETAGVDPVSSISADGMTLSCNLGTQNMGTAVVVQAPMQVTGKTGDAISATGTIAGNNAAVPPIEIQNTFGMDILWGQPTNITNFGTGFVDIDFEWTLNLASGSPAGPDSVSYDLTIAAANGSAISVAPDACSAFTAGTAKGHPWSGGTHPSDRMAPFVGSCTLVPLGGDQFRLTLTGIDYSGSQNPTKDSSGAALSPAQAAIAGGSIWLRIATTTNTGVRITSTAPLYTAPSGETSQDDAGNNTSSKTITFLGGHSSAWNRSFTDGGGTPWDDTYRVAPGVQGQVFSVSGLGTRHTSQDPAAPYGLCQVLDSRYVTFSAVSFQSPGATSEELASVVYEYYVGNDATVDPNSAGYDPNAFSCGSGGSDVGATGWVTAAPSDLALIKAVRAQIPFGALSSSGNSILRVNQTINSGTPIGTDVWQFGSYRMGAEWIAEAHEVNGDNALTPTPGARYPYTTNERDILRVIGVTPLVDKSVDRTVVRVGRAAVYTLDYQAVGETATGTIDDFTLVDTLPAGMHYVTGSASPEPSVGTNASGREVLTWVFDAVPTNMPLSLTYQAQVDESVVGGDTLENSVVASVDGRKSAPAKAQVAVSTHGTTTIGKTADQEFIPNVKGDGVGAGSWTVTLRSFDTTPQSFTDTIDILPYNGDGRGTSHSGSYALTGVTAVAGSAVYYTTAHPATLSDDPADPANGAAGNVAGNTVGWTTVQPANATAVRVIGPSLAPGATQTFQVGIQTTGVTGGDVLVNRAQARAGHTELVMRTSAPITVANHYSASLKKYVKDSKGDWHDANTVEDYPSFRTGDKVTYRIAVTNTGQGTLNNVVVSDDKYPAEGGFTIASLAPGAEQTHEFEITLGPDLASTFVNTASARADTPPDSQVPPTINSDPAGIEIANYTTMKTSDPASGTTVVAGQKVTYTVTVKQNGSAPASAVFTDDLTAVLDDATYNGDAIASVGTVSVAGNGLSWNGTVPIGGAATITYSVTVKTPAAGDQILTNAVTSPGCVPVNGQFPDCTTNHAVGAYTISKTSDPVSGSSVVAGQNITYTVQIRQAGPGALAAVTAVDDLSKVLDDATFNGDATASAGTVNVISPTLEWTGDLPVGAVVTITYSVTVGATGTGDGTLTNVAAPVTPGGSCVPAVDQNPDCTTTHPVSELSVIKSVDPASGTTVSAGEVLNYTLTFKNTGTGPHSVNYTDLLSGVLDDAAITTQPVASDGTLTASTVTDGAFTIAGALAPGATVTVTYAVTVNADGARGDELLTNFVFQAGGRPAAVCVTGDPLCTTNPVTTPPSAPLAMTGANVMGAALLALFALLGGGALLAFRRRTAS